MKFIVEMIIFVEVADTRLRRVPPAGEPPLGTGKSCTNSNERGSFDSGVFFYASAFVVVVTADFVLVGRSISPPGYGKGRAEPKWPSARTNLAAAMVRQSEELDPLHRDQECLGYTISDNRG